MAIEKQTMVRKTRCASCGADVPIYSRASVQAVCPFCRSTLVRKDMQWENIGKMAAVAADLTPLHIGLQGKYKNTTFTIIGRLQQQYAEGVWNEWLLQLNNRKTAWLSEGSGLYYLTTPSTTTDVLPTYDSLSLGHIISLDGQRYSVSNIESAHCIATEGEIPFAAEPGNTAHFVDLSGEDSRFASLDYSDERPKLYTGSALNLSEVQLNDVDTRELLQQPAKELRCAGCGNAITLHNPVSLIVACASCNMVNDKSAEGKLIAAYRQANQTLRPYITLGSHGVLEGHRYEVIGFMRRNGGGDAWDEYLLYNPSQGIRWLTCADGHWSLLKPCVAPVNARNFPSVSISHKSRTYKHFSAYSANVQAVLGEFYWQVTRSEKSHCIDYICPPYILSSETTNKEVVWSEGYYLAASDVATAFGVEKKSTHGVAINQPSPSVLGYVTAYLLSLALCLMISTVLGGVNTQRINIGTLALIKQEKTAKLLSEPFRLQAAHGLFQVQTSTNVNNDWANFEYVLVNQTTGETRTMNREIAYYSGYDSDGSWSEGAASDRALLADVVAGNYVLEVNAETDSSSSPGTSSVVNATVSATHAEPSGSNFWLLFWGLGIAPVLAGLNKYYFEKRRWDKSDHPWEHFQ